MGAVVDPLAEYPTEIIQLAALRIWRAFREWAELDDCRQEAWVCYFTYRREFDQRLAEGEDWYVGKAIRNWVAAYARRQKSIACGYQTSDEEFYSRRRARALLEYFLSGESTPPAPSAEPGMKIKRKSASDGTESHVELLDIANAWSALDQASRDALWLAYGPDDPEPGTYGDTDRQRARRALGRLLDLLNGET